MKGGARRETGKKKQGDKKGREGRQLVGNIPNKEKKKIRRKVQHAAN